MNFLRHRSAEPLAPGLESDLAAAYAVPVPELAIQFNAAPAAGPSLSRRRLTPRRAALATGAVAVVAAALLAIPMVVGGGTTPVSAEEIVSRAQQAAASNLTANGKPYHLVATTNAPLKDGAPGSRTETWSLDATHVRTETTESRGEVFGTSMNGAEFWLWSTMPDGLHVVHVANMPEEDQNFSPPGAALSFADYLGAASAKDCQSRQQQGTEQVNGREAYVVLLLPDPGNCPDSKRNAVAEAGGSTRIWVDRETSVALRMQTTASGGAIVYAYEVTEFEVGGAIPASTFTYQPPAGTAVTEAPNIQRAKGALVGDEKRVPAGDPGFKTAGKSESGPQEPADANSPSTKP